MAGRQAHQRVGESEHVVRPVGEVCDRVVRRHEPVGVVLALVRRRHGVVERGDNAADWEHGAQEALTEGVAPNRVAERGEVQRVRWGSSRVARQSGLRAVDHEPALGQADRGARATGGVDRRIEVVYPDVDRLADAGAVQTQAGEEFIELANAGKESFKYVALYLARRVANDLSLLAGEPVSALRADVLVVGDAQDVRAAEGVGGLIAGRPGRRRSADRRVVGRRGSDAETSCGADS